MCNPWITVKIVYCLRYIEDTTKAFILLHLKFMRKGMQVYVMNVYSIWNACGCLRFDVWVCVCVCPCVGVFAAHFSWSNVLVHICTHAYVQKMIFMSK